MQWFCQCEVQHTIYSDFSLIINSELHRRIIMTSFIISYITWTEYYTFLCKKMCDVYYIIDTNDIIFIFISRYKSL